MRDKPDMASPCGLCGETQPNRFRIWFDGYIKVYRCRTCGLVAQYPGPGRDTILRGDYATCYDLTFTASATFKYPGQRRGLEDILERLRRYRGGGDLLDVGCGDGQFLALAVRAGYAAQGIEPSEPLAAYASRQSGAPVRQGFYDLAAFDGDSFDIITLIQVLEHIPAPLALLEAVRHHLRPGGVVVVEVPSITSPGFLAYRMTGLQRFVAPPRGVIPSHCNYFHPRSLKRLLDAGGFVTEALWTGRWGSRYGGTMGRIGRVLDPLLQATGIGGILYLGVKGRG